MKTGGIWALAGISKKFPDNNSVPFTTVPDGFDFSFVWNHNLNYFPKITITDVAGQVSICIIQYTNANSIKILTNSAFSGVILF